MTMRELLKTRRNASQPAVAGGSVKPGVERSGTPGISAEISPAREVGDSPCEFRAVARFAGCGYFETRVSWGSAALHPRLYATAQLRGLKSSTSKPSTCCAKPFRSLFLLVSIVAITSSAYGGERYRTSTRSKGISLERSAQVRALNGPLLYEAHKANQTLRAAISMNLTPRGLSIQRRQRSQKKSPAAKPVVSADSSRQREVTALLSAGKLEQAEALARAEVDANPRNTGSRILMGIVFDQIGRSNEAEQEYREALRLDPQSVAALTNLGVLLGRADRAAEAIASHEKALILAPNHRPALFNLGALYVANKDYVRAIGVLERAARSREPNDVTLSVMLVNAYAHAGRTSETARLLKEIESLNQDNPNVLFTVGISLASAGDNVSAARLFARTNSLRPDTYEVLYNLGLALFNTERDDEARAMLQRAATLRPQEPEPFYRLGLIASAKGESENALGLWQRAIVLRPTYPEAQFMIAEELYKHRRFETAVPFYERALEQEPGNVLYYIRLGVTHFRTRHYATAREVFDRANQRSPGNAMLLYLSGYVARAQGLFDEALVFFQRSDAIQPGNVDAIASMGFIYMERGEFEEAEKLLRRAVNLNANHFPANYDLGRLLVRRKLYDEALPILERAAKLVKTDPGIHYQLFIAYSRLKRTADAERELTTFKQLEEARKKGDTMEGTAATDQTAPDIESTRTGSRSSKP